MSVNVALDVLVNPLETTELFQFYINTTFNLGLAKWPAEVGKAGTTNSTADVGLKGPLWYPSSIAGVVNQNQVRIHPPGFKMEMEILI
jgi:hypothetical protein